MAADRILQTLSLAAKAGAVKSGSLQIDQTIKGGRALLLILAGDISENTRKKYENQAAFYHVPVITRSDMETLGHAIGKESRAAVAVTEKGLADHILKMI